MGIVNLQTILGLLRHLLTFGGGALVTAGLSSDGQITEMVGAVITLIGGGWSIWEKSQAKKAAAQAATTAGLIAILAFGVAGCASIDPGADKLVVRVEQTQTVAGETFDLVLTADDLNRPFWQANAPAFHEFCEWLRAPITYQSPEFGATNIARVLMMQFQLDDVKRDYKASRASSNDLYTAFITMKSALTQAEAWQQVINTSGPAR
jgi:hypothetical protein